MKKYILSIIVIAIMAGFYSCKKENTGQTVNQENEMIVRSKKVIALIKQFDEKMNSSLKAGELIEIDSAVWNMEALQNYNYAFPDSLSRDFLVVKSHYTITVDANNMVLMSDVQTVNQQMEDSLLYALGQISSDIKHSRFSDVVLDSIVGGTAHLTAIHGFGFNWIMGGYYWGFDEDDDWIWGTLGQEHHGDPPAGKCDGTEVGVSDGSDELQWRLNNPLCTLTEPFVFTDLETRVTNGTDFYNSNGEHRLYFGWDYPEHNCLTNDTLTYYLLQSHDIINTYDYEGGIRPVDKSFASVKIIDDLMMSNNEGWYLHHYYVTYGTIIMVGLPD